MNTNDATRIWEMASNQLRDILHSDVFERWIAVIEPVALEEGTLVLAVDNDFYQTWLEEHYLSLVRDAVSAAGGSELNISFRVKSRAADAVLPGAPAKKQTPREPLIRTSQKYQPLNDRLTFNDFVVGPCNNFAHAASLAVAQAPARAYNPLFIYGGVGLGKTHLMQAIGQYVQRNSHATVCYLSSETFTNEYIDGLQNRRLVQFRKKYRHIDLLLIDDIHFLAGKERLQEEFFHTFNALFDSHKQIVMTSDKPASEIVGLEQRLVSRFEWGLVTELELPDLETRIAILRHKLQLTKLALSDEVIVFMAENIRSNIRRLEGALLRVLSYASLTRQELNIESLRNLLKDTLEEEKSAPLSFSAIQKAVAVHFDVRLTDMTSTRRPRTIAFPRQVAMYLCRRMTEASFPEIAGAFCKTHATVLHACRAVDKRLQSDETLKRNLTSIVKTLGKTLCETP